MILFDSHAHMDDRRFDGDRAELLADFPAQGVKRIMNAACDLDSSLAGIRLCSEYGWIVSAVGSHPDDADHVDEERIEIYRRLAAESWPGSWRSPSLSTSGRPTPTGWRSSTNSPASSACSTASPAPRKWPGRWCAGAGMWASPGC